MPATTTRQSAASSTSRTASSRCSRRRRRRRPARRRRRRPARRTPPRRRPAASDVPAETTQTVPRAVGQRAHRDGPARPRRSSARANAARTAAIALGPARVASAARSGCASRSAAQQRDRLLGRLAGAVDDLGVAGPPGPVDVEPGEAEVRVAAVHPPTIVRQVHGPPRAARVGHRPGAASDERTVGAGVAGSFGGLGGGVLGRARTEVGLGLTVSGAGSTGSARPFSMP